MLLKTVANIYRQHKTRRVLNSRYPQDIFLFVTAGCNSKCPHCFYWQKDLKNELTDAQIVRIIDALPEETNSICITGGEPTLRREIILFVEHALRKAARVTICTNGIRIKRIQEIATAFKKDRNRLNFQVSIDGDQATHDRIRGNGAYKATIASIDALREAKFSIIAVMTISTLNSEKVETVFKDLNGLVSEIRINIIRSSADSVWHLPASKLNISHNPRDDQISLPLEILKTTRARLLKITQEYPLWKLHNQLLFEKTIEIISTEKKQREHCFAGIKEAVIYQTGDVSFCEFYRPFGNLSDFDFNFMRLWDSQIRRSNMKYIQNCCCLHSCNLSSSINFNEQFIIKSIQSTGLWQSAYRAAKKTYKAKFVRKQSA
jgi:MoaA/NifB/PqqE/SkfB family radical SAM enzyme